MIRILYRTCAHENNKARPEFYSKQLCLQSLYRALDRFPNATLHIINDGAFAQEHILNVVTSTRDIHYLPEVGNSASFEHAVRIASSFSAEDLIYFVEDDYLHVPDALAKLAECYQCVPADYITLYDHPVRYFPDTSPHADWPLRVAAIYQTASHNWRTVESTCMTFAARTKTILEDGPIILKYVSGRTHPADRELFRHLQGLGPYRGASPNRLLVGPVPSLASHCELPWLAPAIDWETFARAT